MAPLSSFGLHGMASNFMPSNEPASTGTLVLRDIHQPPAPSWWPLAPGWWGVLAIVVLLLAIATLWWWRRRRTRRAVTRLFDAAVDAAPTPMAQVGAMSELLRRAARRRDPAADRLQGDAWLAFLDRDAKRALFATASGRLLLDGAFRRQVDAGDVEALRPLARRRYLEWMAR